MAWGDNPWVKSWPIEIDKPHGKDIDKFHIQEWPILIPTTTTPIKLGVDLSSERDKSITVVIENSIIIKEYSNKVPTHDPYTNPNSHIYYQCSCGKILDPGTKSFAQLNNVASRDGWKIRCGADTYVPYCVDCGKDVD